MSPTTQRFVGIGFLALGMALCSTCFCGAQDHVDLAGDALPKSALLRMGSLRLSSPDGVMELLLSKDQKTLVSLGNVIIGWDTSFRAKRGKSSSHVGCFDTNSSGSTQRQVLTLKTLRHWGAQPLDQQVVNDPSRANIVWSSLIIRQGQVTVHT